MCVCVCARACVCACVCACACACVCVFGMGIGRNRTSKTYNTVSQPDNLHFCDTLQRALLHISMCDSYVSTLKDIRFCGSVHEFTDARAQILSKIILKWWEYENEVRKCLPSVATPLIITAEIDLTQTHTNTAHTNNGGR